MARCPAAALIPGPGRRTEEAKQVACPRNSPPLSRPSQLQPPRRRHYRHYTSYTHTPNLSMYSVTDTKLNPSMVFFSQPPTQTHTHAITPYTKPKDNAMTAARPPSQIQTVKRHNVAADLGQAQLKLVLELLAAHDLGGLGHLPQQLLEAAEQPDERALVGICHFAACARQSATRT